MYIKIAQSLALAAALLALLAGIFGIQNIIAATDLTKMVETWRVVGFFTFASLFFLLGTRLVYIQSLWLVVIANKLTLTIIGLAYGSTVTGALTSAAWDTTLTVLLGTAYGLVRYSSLASKK